METVVKDSPEEMDTPVAAGELINSRRKRWTRWSLVAGDGHKEMDSPEEKDALVAAAVYGRECAGRRKSWTRRWSPEEVAAGARFKNTDSAIGHKCAVVPPLEGVGGGGTSYGWGDCNVQLTSGVNRNLDPTKVPSADLLHVWCMPSTANVGQQETPRPLETISLLVARNERESAQIALRAKVSWNGAHIAGRVRVHCSDLCSSSGDRLSIGESLTLRHVVPILGVPDVLLPLNLPTPVIDIFPGETASLWLSIDVGASQVPGQYEGEIFITALKSEAENFWVLMEMMVVLDDLSHVELPNLGIESVM